jgi:hypothetical protein
VIGAGVIRHWGDRRRGDPAPGRAGTGVIRPPG